MKKTLVLLSLFNFNVFGDDMDTEDTESKQVPSESKIMQVKKMPKVAEKDEQMPSMIRRSDLPKPNTTIYMPILTYKDKVRTVSNRELLLGTSEFRFYPFKIVSIKYSKLGKSVNFTGTFRAAEDIIGYKEESNNNSVLPVVIQVPNYSSADNYVIKNKNKFCKNGLFQVSGKMFYDFFWNQLKLIGTISSGYCINEVAYAADNVYKYTDKNGMNVYTNKPIKNSKKVDLPPL